jgi:putative flippase GtrA
MKLVKLIHSFLDFFYPLFKRFFDRTTYYYAVCGASNLILSWFLFFIFYNYLFKKKDWELPLLKFTLSAHTFTAFLCFIISFSIGFTLLKYVVFTKSQLKGTTQLFRYAVSALITSFTSWILLKILIETFNFFPTLANISASCIVVVISYLLQRKFSFK